MSASLNGSSPATKPVAPEVIATNIPEVLRATPQWVVWRYEEDVDPETGEVSYDKPPASVKSGKLASVTNPATWSTFDEAMTAYRYGDRWDGVGIVLRLQPEQKGPVLVAVDLDKCRDPQTGAIEPWAAEVVEKLNTYTELSPSGRGLRLFCLGDLPERGRRRGKFEAYNDKRYVTVTGQRLHHLPQEVRDRTDQLLEVHRSIFGDGNHIEGAAPQRGTVSLTDQELLDKARNSKGGDKFARLWDGDIGAYNSRSEADAALANYLAFWTSGNEARIEELLRASGLFRSKWNRPDYLKRTIELAMRGRADFYDPVKPQSRNGRRHNQEEHQEQAEQQSDTAEPGADEPGAENGEDARPQIILGVEEHQVVAQAARALAEGDHGLFQRGGQLVRVVRPSQQQGRRIRLSSSPQIETLPVADLRTRITRNMRLFTIAKVKEDVSQQPAHPPRWLVEGIAALGEWKGVRHLEAVVESPVLRPDGSVLDVPGYDSGTGLLYELSADYQPFLVAPTKSDASCAVAALLEVVRDFPFEKPMHRSAWIAAILTAVARFAFDGPAPLFLFDANVRGAGKGLLADLVSIIVSGREFARALYSKDGEELRKTITAIALAGERLVLFDNLAGSVGGPALDAALTATEWQDRLLGHSQRPRLPLPVTWFATGNNVSMQADTARRTCHIRLLSPEEKPEDRSDFHHANLLGWVRQERPRLLAAALTILAAYCHAGCPHQELKPWGSYEGWSALVRSAIVWAGQPDPGEARMTQVEGADRDVAALKGLLVGWQELDPDAKGLTIAEALNLLKDSERQNSYKTMRATLAEIYPLKAGELPTSGQLGYRLRSLRNRVCDGLLFEGNLVHGSVTKWRVLSSKATPGVHNGGDEAADGGDGFGIPTSATNQKPSVSEGSGGDGGDGGDLFHPSAYEESLNKVHRAHIAGGREMPTITTIPSITDEDDYEPESPWK